MPRAASPPDEAGAFARFCAALTLDSDRPMAVEPFQAQMLEDFFAGAAETLILIPKKNGKSTLLAALALFHLVTTPDAECVVGAASRDQATILYDQAAGFVRRSPGLADRVSVKRGYREIQSRRDAGRIRVLAADVDTADGVIPSLALVDELHRHRSAGLYGVFRDGLGPRAGRMVTISTAGDSENSPLGLMRAAARDLPLTVSGAYHHSRSANGGFALHEWSLDREADTDDMAAVKAANPASWQTIEALRARHDSPSMLAWQWARFACGIWMAGEDWWLSADQWQTARVTDALQPGDAITLGFDGSRVGDSTALVACRLTDPLVVPLALWEHPAGIANWEVPGREVDDAMAAAFDNYRVVRAYLDPPLWQTEIEAWADDYGSAIQPWATNRTAQMSAAVERFRTDLLTGVLRHNGDRRLARHVMNARMRTARIGYTLARDSAAEKIDAAVAAVLAYEARADALADGANRPRGRVVAF